MDHRVPGRLLEIKSELCGWALTGLLFKWPENREYFFFLIITIIYHINFFNNL